MFGKFTDSARATLRRTIDRAKHLRLGAISPEIIFLELISHAGAASEMLRRLNVDTDDLRARIAALAARASPDPIGTTIPFDPRGKRTIELANAVAEQLDAPAVGPGHLLLAILTENSGGVADALTALGGPRAMSRSRSWRVASEALMPDAPLLR